MAGRALDEDHILTDKQLLFCVYYVDTLNQTKAAIMAGYSERTARTSAVANMKNPNIRAKIEQLFKENNISKDEITNILIKLAKTDISDYTEEVTSPSGEVKTFVNVKKMKKEGKGFLIKGVKNTTAGQTIEFDDRLRALEILAKVQGLFNDNKPQDINVSVQVDGLENLLTKVYGRHDPDSDD
jgi:phage terminase small subunit